MKSMVLGLKKYLMTLVLFTVVGYFALVLVYLIPNERMKTNLKEDVKIIAQEVSCQPIPGQRDTYLDNQTDSIMLLECAYEGSENVFDKAIYVPHEDLGNHVDSVKQFIDYYSNPNHTQGETINYERYWHGYLVFLRPLYFMMNYGYIRRLMGILHIGIIVTLVMTFTLKGKWQYSIPLTLSYIFLNPQTVAVSLQYNSMFILSYLYLLWIVCNEDKYRNRKNWTYSFYIVGCLTSYFDYLTYPLLTYGLAIVFLLTEYRSSVKEDIIEAFKCGIIWGIGYVFMWAMKWIINIVYSRGAFLVPLLERLVFRSTGGGLGEKYTHWSVFVDELYYYNLYLYFVALCFSLGCILYTKKKINISVVKKAVPLIIVSIFPILWDQLIISHAFYHYFTYRKYAMTIFAIGCFGVSFIFDSKAVASNKKNSSGTS